jgi:regulatory protein
VDDPAIMKITAIKQQVKRADRYSVFVDETYAFSVSESALLELRLASGQELDAKRLAELKEASGADKAYGNALRYVAMRPRSEWELQTYLRRKEVEEPVAESIIERLRNVRLLDDVAFARAWVANRRLLKATSLRKLRLELKQKRVAEPVIDQILAEDDTDERDALRQLVAKKRARYPDDLKLMQYLARQGFSYDDIKSVLHADADD